MCEGFVFYRSFAEALRDLPAEEYKSCVQALVDYALDDKEDEMSGITRMFMTLVKPQVDANKKRRENGGKGGRPRKTEIIDSETEDTAYETEIKPNNNLDITEPEPKEKDKEKAKEKDKEVKSITDVIDCQPEPDIYDITEVMDRWNELNTVPPIRTMGNVRKRMLKARLKEYGLPTVLMAIDNIRDSNFLQGDNKTSWTATFDWFVKPTNFAKVLEGNYRNKGPTSRLDFVDTWAAQEVNA